MLARVRRILFGRPLPTWRHTHERLPKFLALPVFASDAISSNAYATGEILHVFVLLGASAALLPLSPWKLAIPITAAIILLLGIVVVSYRLTIFAYPQGGGSYIVTRENLGTVPGLVAAAALLTDYVMTVAVSISAGVAAITSAIPSLASDRVLLAVAAIAIVALANLRGLRESGTLFAVPTYGFVLSIAAMIIYGLYQWRFATVVPYPNPLESLTASGTPITGLALWFLILRAFAGGCAAMTGTEAVADGIPAFKPPESKNAAATLVYMALILAFLFMGITTLAYVYQAYPHINAAGESVGETVVSQIARRVFALNPAAPAQDAVHWFYYVIQAMTAAILILAANTAYMDFPRLSSILARDRFAPRQLANIGDRLVFSNGILALSALAAFLVIAFGANESALIPLYAVGVFISFTLSQFSMSKRQKRLRQPGWRLYSGVSMFGAIMTGIVAVVIASMKAVAGPRIEIGHVAGRLIWIPTGAYAIIILIVVLVYIFHKIHQHYIELGDQLRLSEDKFREPKPVRSTAIVLTAGIHKGILPALEYARALSHDYRALYIEIDQNETALIRDRWEKFGLGVPLVIMESPYRSVVGPVLEYLEEAKKERPDHVITVVVPEFVPVKWWHKILHNQSGLFLKVALLFKRDIVVTNVRYYLER